MRRRRSFQQNQNVLQEAGTGIDFLMILRFSLLWSAGDSGLCSTRLLVHIHIINIIIQIKDWVSFVIGVFHLHFAICILYAVLFTLLPPAFRSFR